MLNSTKNILKFTVIKRDSSNLAPVRLAYASYESTKHSPNPNLPPLIVNHGLFGSKSNWNSLCKVYHEKTHRKIIAPDARNHGDSPHTPEHSYPLLALDLKELCQQLRFEKVSLLGHSMGGRAVMYFALQYPNLVEKLIVADISPITTSPNLKTTSELFRLLLDIELPKNVTMSKARAFVDEELTKKVTDKGLRNFLLTNLIQKGDGRYMWRINIETLMTNFSDIARFPLAENVKYDGPVLFVGGKESDYIREKDHEGILTLFPRAEFRYIEGAGHWLHSDKPTQFLQHTIEFLNNN